MPTYIAVDIGGSKIFAIRTTKKGNIQKKVKIPTEAKKGAKQVVKNLCDTINKVKSPTSVAIGIAWAGLVNSEKGIIAKAPNIKGFENFPLKKELEKKLGLPVFIENDARLFALGEAKFGAKKDYKNLLGIIIGTGIGSGIVINGQLLTGHDGFAGEIGHAIFDNEKNKEVEDHFCASAMKDFLKANGCSQIIEKCVELWLKKDKKTQKVLNKFLDRFSIWISNLILTFNPEIIILGGGIGTHIYPVLIPYIKRKAKKILKEKGYNYTINIRSSKLSNAGALGALSLATQKVA